MLMISVAIALKVIDFIAESNQFILRAHIYQARSLFGSDDTGLSGLFLFCFCYVSHLF